MKKTVLAIATACLMAAPLSFAQSQKTNPAEKPNPAENRRAESRVDQRVDLLTTVFGLSNMQKEQAKKIFTSAENENAAVFANLRTERANLRNAMESNKPGNTLTIKQSSEAIGNDVGKLVANESNAYQQFRNILNPEQQTKFAQLDREVPRWGMNMGFRGPGAFGG